MNNKTLYLLSSIATLVSGLCIIGGKLLAIINFDQAGEILDFFSPLFGLFAVLGIYFWQRKKAGVFGGLAVIIFFIGLTLVVSLDFFAAFILIHLPAGTVEYLMNGPSGPIFVIAGLIFLCGEIFFGVSVFRAGVFSKIAALLFIIGFLPVPLVGMFSSKIVIAGSILAGLALCWWGAELFILNFKMPKSNAPIK